MHIRLGIRRGGWGPVTRTLDFPLLNLRGGLQFDFHCTREAGLLGFPTQDFRECGLFDWREARLIALALLISSFPFNIRQQISGLIQIPRVDRRYSMDKCISEPSNSVDLRNLGRSVHPRRFDESHDRKISNRRRTWRNRLCGTVLVCAFEGDPCCEEAAHLLVSYTP